MPCWPTSGIQGSKVPEISGATKSSVVDVPVIPRDPTVSIPVTQEPVISTPEVGNQCNYATEESRTSAASRTMEFSIAKGSPTKNSSLKSPKICQFQARQKPDWYKPSYNCEEGCDILTKTLLYKSLPYSYWDVIQCRYHVIYHSLIITWFMHVVTILFPLMKQLFEYLI